MVRIGRRYTVGPITGDGRPSDVWERAKDAVRSALCAQPDLAEVQTSCGVLKFWLDWDWPGAEAALRRAIALDGHYAYAFRMLGHQVHLVDEPLVEILANRSRPAANPTSFPARAASTDYSSRRTRVIWPGG